MKINPFDKLPLLNFFQYEFEKIAMASRLATSIRKDLKNIRAAGDQVERAVREFYSEKLYPKFHVSEGHIVDSSLVASAQYDLIISDNTKNPVMFRLNSGSELIYFEPVLLFAEIKRSFYSESLVNDFIENITLFKQKLKRKEIPPNYIETGNSGILIEDNLTSLPKRNPILSFMFFANSQKLSLKKIAKSLSGATAENLPNFIVCLDQGIIVNIDEESHKKGLLRVNLYPEYNQNPGIWVFIGMEESSNTLLYQFMLILQHLNASIVESADVKKYTGNLFNINFAAIKKL